LCHPGRLGASDGEHCWPEAPQLTVVLRTQPSRTDGRGGERMRARRDNQPRSPSAALDKRTEAQNSVIPVRGFFCPLRQKKQGQGAEAEHAERTRTVACMRWMSVRARGAAAHSPVLRRGERAQRKRTTVATAEKRKEGAAGRGGRRMDVCMTLVGGLVLGANSVCGARAMPVRERQTRLPLLPHTQKVECTSVRGSMRTTNASVEWV
jgi:hypothetical protein